MPDNKKIITINDGSSGKDLHAIEVKIDKLMDVKDQSEPSPADTPVVTETAPVTADMDSEDAPAETPPLAEENTLSETATDDESGTDHDEAAGSQEEDQLPADITLPEDEGAEADGDEAPGEQSNRGGFRGRIKHYLRAWWRNRRARWATLGGVLAVLLVLAMLPSTRAFGLNLVGVRATAKLTVLDATTQLPLKNVNVSLGALTARSDQKGQVSFQKVKLGAQPLVVHKIAFATVTKSVTTGLGSNNLGSIALKAVGTQYNFLVTDYVSGKPVSGAQAASGQATALSDTKGNIILTVTDPDTDTLAVSVTASGYRTSTVKVPLGATTTMPVALVSNLKDVYVSKQSGKYDVYSADIDGNNKKVLLPASGNETSNNTLVANGNGQVVALVNNRDNTHDTNGYLLQTLTLITLSSGAPIVIDHSERIQIVDWIGDRLVYVAIKAGASAANPSRYQLMSYDYKTDQRVQLDHANAFNDVVSANGAIYYATSNGYNGGVSQFMRITPDGNTKQTLLVSEVWNVFRLSYTDFRLATGDTNYSYTLGGDKPAVTKDSYNNQNRLYADSPDGKHSVWVDDRDGKGTLVAYDTSNKKETVLAQTAGLSLPVHWLGNSNIVYRMKTPKETADYVVSVNGGAPKKVTDVTDAGGLSLWYYY